MKKEINLRTKDIVLPQQLYFSRLVSCVIITLLLALLVTAFIYLNIYRNRIEDRLAVLKGINEEIRVSVAPVEEMERKIALIRDTIEVENRLRSHAVYWTDYINDIQSTADNIVDVDVTLVSGSIDGIIMIDGRAPTLEKIAVYTQSLEQFGYLDDIYFEHMEYNIIRGDDPDDIPSYDSEESFYSFTIYGSLSDKK